jgi:hypothetical protein
VVVVIADGFFPSTARIISRAAARGALPTIGFGASTAFNAVLDALPGAGAGFALRVPTLAPRDDGAATLAEDFVAPCRAFDAALRAFFPEAAFGAAFDAAFGVALNAAFGVAFNAAFAVAFGAAVNAAFAAAFDVPFEAFDAALLAGLAAAFRARFVAFFADGVFAMGCSRWALADLRSSEAPRAAVPRR